MKKILLAFDVADFSEGIFEFARRLNELHPVLLTGVFLPLYNYVPVWGYPDGMAGYNFLPALDENESAAVQKNIDRFETLCQHNGIAYRVHKDFNFLAMPELKKETRFADLLIISSEKFYINLASDAPNPYLHEALNTAECPVVVVPETFRFPERNVLAYDGSETSLFAIKQFAYLFPELCENETLLVFSGTKEKGAIPDEQYIEELATQHFKNLTLFKLDINPKKYFNTWASEESGAIVVSGSYGRSSLSQLLHKSFVTDVIAAHKLPVFIAHQ
jgi:nucleotide-binding universal stress UspA family protein